MTKLKRERFKNNDTGIRERRRIIMQIPTSKAMNHTDAWLKEVYEQVICHDNSPYVYIEMNIKQFRYLNAKFGILFGDQVLQKILLLLIDILEEGYVSHRYADTFDMLVPYDYKKNDIRLLMSRIVDSLFEIDIPEIHQNIYTSFGVYFLHDFPEYEMLKTYTAIARKGEKTLPKRTFSYEVLNKPNIDLLSSYVKNHELESTLTNARFNKEYQIYIQPKVDLHTHKISGGEVLTRWIHENSIAPLSSFMPVLKENGEMYMIDLGHFEIMCKLLKERDIHHKKVVPISFNVTNRSMFHENFIEDYTRIYQTYTPRKSLIEFEFMEDIHYEHGCEVLSIIQYLNQMGFACSLDDFGNGIASFNVLLSGNIDIIKMDRLFFMGELDEQKKHIICDIIDIAKIKKIKVLAEGIETKEYVDFLEEQGCDYIQGFYFYRPMPLEKFIELLDKDPIVY